MARELSDMGPVYRDFDIFVLPSLHEEISISLLKDMAIGIPVMATNMGGMPWLLDYDTYRELIPS